MTKRVRICTSQLNFGKVIPKDEPYAFIDTTVKSGGPFSRTFLAPEWSWLTEYKAATRDGPSEEAEAEYTRNYIKKLNKHRDVIIGHFKRFIELSGVTDVVLGCYCGNGKFCHRHLLAWFLKKHLPELEHAGELENTSIVTYDDWNPTIVHFDGDSAERTKVGNFLNGLFANHRLIGPADLSKESEAELAATIPTEAEKLFKAHLGPLINLTGALPPEGTEYVTVQLGCNGLEELRKLLWKEHRVLMPTPLPKDVEQRFAKYCELAEEPDERAGR